MATSFPAREVTTRHGYDGQGQRPSLVVHVGRVLRRGYEHVCSAIFDPDGDCMRL